MDYAFIEQILIYEADTRTGTIQTKQLLIIFDMNVLRNFLWKASYCGIHNAKIRDNVVKFRIELNL